MLKQIGLTEFKKMKTVEEVKAFGSCEVTFNNEPLFICVVGAQFDMRHKIHLLAELIAAGSYVPPSHTAPLYAEPEPKKEIKPKTGPDAIMQDIEDDENDE
jgi:hypothetical protein